MKIFSFRQNAQIWDAFTVSDLGMMWRMRSEKYAASSSINGASKENVLLGADHFVTLWNTLATHSMPSNSSVAGSAAILTMALVVWVFFFFVFFFIPCPFLFSFCTCLRVDLLLSAWKHISNKTFDPYFARCEEDKLSVQLKKLRKNTEVFR